LDVMSKLCCKCDCIWKLKPELLDALMGDFLNQDYLKWGKPAPNVAHAFIVAAHIKNMGEGSFAVCLFALMLTGKFLYPVPEPLIFWY
ncbi:hypothetical protein STEG23_015483, partial [Scotinomys teguina]